MSGSLSSFKRGIYLIIGTLFLSVIVIGSSVPANALSVSSARDCDNNAIIYCGALSTSELQRKYNDSDDIQRIFSHFGLNSSHIDSIDEKAVVGYVNSDNTVTVNGKVVATDVVTLGRQNMEGSTAVVYKNGTFYKRPPSVSFASTSIPAFVVMNNGKFGYAVIASCGNPVIKRTTPNPAPQPDKEAPKTEKPAPPVSTNSQSSASAVASASVTNVYNQSAVPAPAPTQATVQAPLSQPAVATPAPQRELPKTGAAAPLAFASLSGIVGSIGHFIYKRRYS